MTAQHLLLVEEQSMEAFLRCLLPRVLPEGHMKFIPSEASTT